MIATPEYIVSKLCKLGYETYVVGGAVRDFLSGKLPADEDIVTNATPKEIEDIFKDHKLTFAGTYFKVTFVDGIEVATFRKDVYGGLSDKNVEIKPAETIQEDLARRDLTINAIAWCQFTGKLVDPYRGQTDLKKRQIKFVGRPVDRIKEDPNRIVRACRFLAAIDGEFDYDTFYALKAYASYVRDYVAPERIRLEVLKAMKARYASVFFNALHRIGALQYVLPSLECCYHFPDEHGLHHRESIISHSYFTGDNISTKYPLVKLAAYLHDIGKPASCRFNPKTGDLKFTGHDVLSAEIAEKELKALTFSNDEIKYISKLIRLHMNNFASPKAIRKTITKLDGIPWEDLYRLKLADSKANIAKGPFPLSGVKKDFQNIHDALNVKSPNDFRDLAINGKDIMEILDLKPGPIVGQLKNRLLDLVLEFPEMNEREQLIEFVRSLIQNDKVS